MSKTDEDVFKEMLAQEQNPKVRKAMEFINRIRTSNPADLNKLVETEATEDLGQFFMQYSFSLLLSDPTRIMENASSLFLMGYLVRANEEQERLTAAPAPEVKPDNEHLH